MNQIKNKRFVQYYENFEYDDSHFIVLEYCNGGSLQNYIQNRKSLDIFEVLRIVLEIAVAIYFLHKNKIAHRDIKCENVLIHDGKIKLADFDLSKESGNLMSFSGTRQYLAPEVAQKILDSSQKDKKYSKKVDVWSLGVLFYYMLTNQYPFNGKNMNEACNNILKDKLKFPSEFKKKIPKKIIDLIKSCLQKDQRKRISIRQFLQNELFDLHRYLFSYLDFDINQDINIKGKERI